MYTHSGARCSAAQHGGGSSSTSGGSGGSLHGPVVRLQHHVGGALRPVVAHAVEEVAQRVGRIAHRVDEAGGEDLQQQAEEAVAVVPQQEAAAREAWLCGQASTAGGGVGDVGKAAGRARQRMATPGPIWSANWLKLGTAHIALCTAQCWEQRSASSAALTGT